MDLCRIRTFPHATYHHFQEGNCYLHLHLPCVRNLDFLTSPAKFIFYSHPSITISRARHDESTGNLKRHVNSCIPLGSSQTRSMAIYASSSTYMAASHRMKIALWVSKYNRPFSIVEDEDLLEIFTDLNPNCITPMRWTVSRDVNQIFALSRTQVGALLRVSSYNRTLSNVMLTKPPPPHL